MFKALVSLAVVLPAAFAATTITSDASVASGQTYDYVIAGAGLTGIVVGNKLSAKGYKVLIIEPGKDLKDHPPIFNAERRSELAKDPSTDCNWHYEASDDNGQPLAVKIDAGKCVGGSTSINGMVWYRPTTKELDLLGEFGNSGWNAKSLVPLMTEAERNVPPTLEQRLAGADVVASVHGKDGPVITSFSTPPRIPLLQPIYKAAMKLIFGTPLSKDLSSRTSSVTASTSWTIQWDPVAKINRRISAAYGWLYPASQQRDTLTVLTGHIVGKVTFKGTKATGFEFGPADGGQLRTVTARKEVILAAGTLGTAPILERSGVGSKTILNKFGIKQVVDLPGVGLNLQDQPGTGLSALIKSANATNPGLVDGRNQFAPVITLANIDELFKGDAAKVRSSLQSTLESRAQAAVQAGTQANLEGSRLIFQKHTELLTKHNMPLIEIIGESYPAVFTTVFWPLLPMSRGHIHINSADPFARPRITPRLLTDSFDVQVAIKLAKLARSMFLTNVFSPLVADAAADGVPLNASDAEWEKWLKESSFGASHWAGACAMIPRKAGGVVSPQLQVYGTESLRVVDVSILPLQITSHTMPMAYAIALKAAQLILSNA